MKRFLVSIAVSTLMFGNASAAADVLRGAEKGASYDDLYTSEHIHDFCSTESAREGVYSTDTDGSIYSSEDSREGVYTTDDSLPEDRVSGFYQ